MTVDCGTGIVQYSKPYLNYGAYYRYMNVPISSVLTQGINVSIIS